MKNNTPHSFLNIYRAFGLAGIFMLPASTGWSQNVEPPPPPAIRVTVEKVQLHSNNVERKYIGQVEAIDSVAIQPRVSGNIMATDFEEGGKVEKGQLLFQIEDTQYKARVHNAKALIGQITSKLDYAKISLERYELLVKNSSVSQDNVDSARSTVSALEAEIMAAEAELAIAEDNLRYTKITSPIDGRVGRQTYSIGNYITPQSSSLLTVTSLSEVYVRFPISERDLLSIFGNSQTMREQALLTLTLADNKPYEHQGFVAMADNQIKSTTDTLTIWSQFTNPEEALIPGGIVTVHLSRKTDQKLPAVTISAVMYDQDRKSYVYVLNKDNVVERREVELGNMIDHKQCLRSGVKVDDIVIIDGMHKVRPGVAVEPVFSKN